MTTTTSASLDLLRARMATAIGGRMPGHIERLSWSAGQLAGWQRARLRMLLARAIDRSPFHTARLAGIDPARFELADLPRLPVMTKAQMMERFEEVVTDQRLTRDVVDQHIAASVAEAALLFGDYVCLVSGGSSGLRGVFVQTAGEYAEFAASLMRRAMAAFLAGGGQLADGLVIGIVAAASPVHSSGMAAATATGPPLRLVSAPATWPTARIVERLNAAQPPALIGHASKLAELAGEQRAGRLRLRLRAVTSVSEMLTPEDREAISGAFGVPVINTFVSTEGLVGHSDPGGMMLTFASDTCIAECVDDAGRPVPNGTASARVLVTNLHNLTQPLIRYELTDHFTPAGPSAGGFLRASVEGRSDDVFRYGATIVHPFALTTALLRAGQVREYQVRQTARGADITVVTDAGLDEAALAAAIEQSLRQAGITEPHVTINRAAAIARDPRTGKVKRFIATSHGGRSPVARPGSETQAGGDGHG
jgi:phenylacetate-coenzyme A ligase PaaK-like adenylate-forming protein